jgi:hypothetical protein
MSADKRTVSTDALETLGTIIGPNEKRDAIHLAVIPAVAGANLKRGADVRLDHEGLAVNAYEEDETEAIGIVDPFLPRNEREYGADVKPGQRFWLVIYPRKITSLRHVWSHPAFPEEATDQKPLVSQQTIEDFQRLESKQWLESFAQRLFSYEPDHGSRLEVLLACAESGGFGTDIEYGEGCKPDAEFWMHFERYTGRKVIDRPDWFRCAC